MTSWVQSVHRDQNFMIIGIASQNTAGLSLLRWIKLGYIYKRMRHASERAKAVFQLQFLPAACKQQPKIVPDKPKPWLRSHEASSHNTCLLTGRVAICSLRRALHPSLSNKKRQIINGDSVQRTGLRPSCQNSPMQVSAVCRLTLCEREFCYFDGKITNSSFDLMGQAGCPLYLVWDKFRLPNSRWLAASSHAHRALVCFDTWAVFPAYSKIKPRFTTFPYVKGLMLYLGRI